MDTRPLGAAEFDRLMRRLGPFGPRPAVAVAVSGGADSMALAVLTDQWVRRRRGSLTALTVDHRLRAGSGAEARLVGRRLAERDTPHRILVWRGDKPATGIQAAARRARYALLEGWCAANAVPFLLLAHHRDDQAETVLLRLAHGSGPDGLAGMAAVAETDSVRLARPLLDVAPDRLRATLRAHRLDWVEDPSNNDRRFARVRLRTVEKTLSGEGLTPARLAETARRAGRARAALDGAVAALLGRAAAVYPEGYASLDMAALARAEPEIARRALGRLLASIGGSAYPPPPDRLDALEAALRDGSLRRPRTLGGCVLQPRRGALLISREPGRIAPPVPLDGRRSVTWDGRFRADFGPMTRHGTGGAALGALGAEGWRFLAGKAPLPPLPAPAGAALPAIRDRHGLVLVPHLGYRRRSSAAGDIPLKSLQFRPERALAGAAFGVV